MENPDKVLHFFREICAIPHASYDEKRISDYFVSFAKERGLEVIQDSFFNVIIKKPASIKNCKCAPVIIQGHSDMVYVKSADCKRDYEQGIDVIERDGWLCTGETTTLGADDGIAVAYALALLDSNDIPHPDLEIVLTVQEEVGLAGAAGLDYSALKGKYFINIDTEDEGIFYTSCAGAVRNDLEIPIKRELVLGGTRMDISLGGLLGGHSGMEIQLCRGNAIVLMARLLMAIEGSGAHLASMKSDGKMNAIASRCDATIYLASNVVEGVKAGIAMKLAQFNHELEGRDKVSVDIKVGEAQDASCYTPVSKIAAISAILLMPNGALGMSQNIPGLVETSSNPGILIQKEDAIEIASCIRSSIGSRKWEVAERIEALARLTGGKSRNANDYPQWEYHADSPLRELAMESYRQLFSKEPETRAIHAGLECGYFDERLNKVDIISFGPDQFDVHTPFERASIKSIENVWMLLQDLLEKLGQQ